MMDEYIKREDALEAIRKWCGDCGRAIEAVLEENHQLFSVRRDERIPDLAYISCAVSLQPGEQGDADAEL